VTTSSHRDRAFKDALYGEFARIGKAVANSHRLELLDLLAQGERRVEELALGRLLPQRGHVSAKNVLSSGPCGLSLSRD